MPDADLSYRPGRGEVDVDLFESTDPLEGRPIAVVTWNGDEHLVPRAPAAYFDKIFCNLRNDKGAAHDLLQRVVRFVHDMKVSETESLFAGSANYERLTIPGKGGIPLPAAAVRDEAAGKPFAGVKAKIVATDSVLGATTHFRPRFRGQNPTNAESGFWALWDWMALRLLRTEQYDVLARAYNAFTYQLSLYQAHGIPGLTEMGAVPLAAVMAMEAKEDTPIDLHYLIGRVRHELAEHATSEAGRPLAYPGWLLRQFVKLQILSELGLLDDRIVEAHESETAAGELSEHGIYGAELDRAIKENDLAAVVEDVFAAVTTTDASDIK